MFLFALQPAVNYYILKGPGLGFTVGLGTPKPLPMNVMGKNERVNFVSPHWSQNSSTIHTIFLWTYMYIGNHVMFGSNDVFLDSWWP